MIIPEIFKLQNLIEEAAERYADIPALSYVDGGGYSYSELLAQVRAISAWLHAEGFAPGDKIAILAENGPNWGAAYLGINRCGGITVPILPDFSPEETANILAHAEAKAVFVSKRLQPKVTVNAPEESAKIKVYSIDTLSPLNAGEGRSCSDFDGQDFSVTTEENDLATIIYTSGTTGQSKGVMLSNKALVWDAWRSAGIPTLEPRYKMLSILPLSHTYEFTIGFLVLIMTGVSIYYLRKPPSTSVLLPALKKIRPQIMLTVPLLIEKIYRQSVLPKFKKGIVGRIYKTGPGRKVLNRIAAGKLKKTFGGNLVFFGIGGAPLSPEVEQFLRDGKFPYAIGYGLTETAPLIAGSNPKNTVFRAIGPIIPEQQTELRDKNPETGIGELHVKGPNVMIGYYKDEEKTKTVLSEDGWFNTGDMGYMDDKGNLFIKGRSKTMILGPSGENIYPEAIEAMIDEFDFVEESLVLEDESGGLVARIRINTEELGEHLHRLAEKAEDSLKHARESMRSASENMKHSSVNAAEFLDNLKKELNQKLSRFSRVGRVVEQKEPFVRTPTKKIKRYIYQALHLRDRNANGGSDGNE